MNTILFLLKKNELYGQEYTTTTKSGLLNSALLTATQIIKHLNRNAIVKICQDSNEIDKYVTLYKPSLCILEAIWTSSDKLRELTKLHPETIFIIRVHSEIPFLANEGSAIEIIKKSLEITNVFVAFNSFDTYQDFSILNARTIYLPNIYCDSFKKSWNKFSRPGEKGAISIASFGAIRPMKNQLLQAFAAIKYAEDNKLKLKFYINSSRTEQGGQSVLKNIKSLFSGTKHELIECNWMDREEFLNLISQMDIGLQMSFNESFNIVTADFVLEGIPIIVSNTIKWMPDIAKADLLSLEDISLKIKKGIKKKKLFVCKSQKYLRKYNEDALQVWKTFIK